MKKSLKNIVCSLMLVLLLPAIILLSGCGATPSNEARGVKFVSSIYDEETGYAVFEVDLDELTELKFNVMPSSWSGYKPTYVPIVEGSVGNNIKFKRQGNKIRVVDPTFEEIRLKVSVNGHSDICIVRLKEYPIDMYLEKTNVAINAHGVHVMNPIGIFEEKDAEGNVVGTYEKSLLEYDYNFTVKSEDQTIVKVENESRLKVTSVKKGVSSTKVSVTLNDTKGNPYKRKVKEGDKLVVVNEDYTETVTVNVIQNVQSGFLLLDEGHGTFVNDGDTISVKLSELQTDNGQYLFGYKLHVVSDTSLYFEADATSTSNNTRYFTKDETHSNVLRIDPEFATSVDKSVKISVWTNLIDSDGNAFGMVVNVNFEA